MINKIFRFDYTVVLVTLETDHKISKLNKFRVICNKNDCFVLEYVLQHLLCLGHTHAEIYVAKVFIDDVDVAILIEKPC